MGVTKCVPAHLVAEQLPKPVLSSILGFHVLIGCSAMLSFSDKDKNTCWKMYCNLLTVVARGDNLMVLGHLYVHCMGLEKRMSKILMIPGIIFL